MVAGAGGRKRPRGARRTPPAARAAPEGPVLLDLGPEAKLLSEVARDGRASYQELAIRTGRSRQTVWRRLRGLVGTAIWGFTAVLDHHRLGWRQYILTVPAAPDLEMVRHVDEAEAAVATAGTVRVLQACLVKGASWRFVIHVATRNSLALEAFLGALRERLGHGSAGWQLDEVEYVVREGALPNPRNRAILEGRA